MNNAGGRPAHTRPINYRETLPRVCANCKKWETYRSSYQRCLLDPNNEYETLQPKLSLKKYRHTCGCFKPRIYVSWRKPKDKP